jgi:hypothetical protein
MSARRILQAGVRSGIAFGTTRTTRSWRFNAMRSWAERRAQPGPSQATIQDQRHAPDTGEDPGAAGSSCKIAVNLGGGVLVERAFPWHLVEHAAEREDIRTSARRRFTCSGDM